MIRLSSSRLSEVSCKMMIPTYAHIPKVCFSPSGTKNLTSSSQPISTSSKVHLSLFRVQPHRVQNFCSHPTSTLPLQLCFYQYEYLEYSYPTSARVNQVGINWSHLRGTRLKHKKAHCWHNRINSRFPYFLKRLSLVQFQDQCLEAHPRSEHRLCPLRILHPIAIHKTCTRLF